jgi:hypothetical protein
VRALLTGRMTDEEQAVLLGLLTRLQPTPHES